MTFKVTVFDSYTEFDTGLNFVQFFVTDGPSFRHNGRCAPIMGFSMFGSFTVNSSIGYNGLLSDNWGDWLLYKQLES